MSPLVFVPEPIHEDALSALRIHADLVLGFGSSRTDLQDILPEIDGILLRTQVFDGATIENANRLRVIARHGVGFDNVDVAAASRNNVRVLITPYANFRSVAEHVMALLLALRRQIIEADQLVRQGSYSDRDRLCGEELHSTRLGIIGLGRVGRHLAHIAQAGFGMHVIAYDPIVSHEETTQLGLEPASDMHSLLERCDAVSVHAPLTPETRGLIGAAELATMPSHAVLLHTARGGVVDEHALVEALEQRLIAGAGIDVFEKEPPRPDNALLALPNVVLSPHTAGLTTNALRQMGLDAAQGIIDILQGRESPEDRPWSMVNGPF